MLPCLLSFVVTKRNVFLDFLFLLRQINTFAIASCILKYNIGREFSTIWKHYEIEAFNFFISPPSELKIRNSWMSASNSFCIELACFKTRINFIPRKDLRWVGLLTRQISRSLFGNVLEVCLISKPLLLVVIDSILDLSYSCSCQLSSSIVLT